jgi:signal peptidase I
VLALAVAALLLAGGTALHARGVSAFVVTSGSMAPAVPTGSLVMTAPAAPYVPGDAIAFSTGAGVVTHRVLAVDPDGDLRTGGDANAAGDPGDVAPAAVRGRVVLALPWAGYGLVFLRQPTTLPALLLAVVLVLLARSMRPALRRSAHPSARAAATGGAPCA